MMRAVASNQEKTPTMKPTVLLAMFNTPQLEGMAREVEDTVIKIMKKAASG